jgi:hypothetical protein
MGGILFCGCRSAAPRAPLEALPYSQAVGLVNDNTRRISGTLRAVGSVDGHFRETGGGRRSYHLDGVLFFLAPCYVRFDLKTFGERQFLFGSSIDQYWFYDKAEDSYHCGRHGVDEDLPEEMPVRPDQLIDALGLNRIPEDERGTAEVFPVHRVEPDHQEVLLIVRDPQGRAVVEKEYWLDRFLPRQVRRVVFRDGSGAVTMESELADYRLLSPEGPILPHSMSARWPGQESRMHFRVSRWTLEPSVSANSPQFAAPGECRER